VGDADVPGIQATVEKLLTYLTVPAAGPQYVHYAFGLLKRTDVFCPEQAVMDDAHIGLTKHLLESPQVSEDRRGEALAMIREVMETDHKTFMYHLPLPTRDPVYSFYPLEDAEGGALAAAQGRVGEIMARPRKPLPEGVLDELRRHVPGVLPQTLAAPVKV
jgi:trimethylamine--corrinoid protein Co-methyltransferase